MPVNVGEYHGNKGLYRLNTPNEEFTAVQMGVKFVDGVGWTKHENKARAMMERFGYTVTLPKGEDPKLWKPAVAGLPESVTEEMPEGELPVGALLDEEEEGNY